MYEPEWTCGYANLSALLRTVGAVAPERLELATFDGRSVAAEAKSALCGPADATSVEAIQRLVERAWDMGIAVEERDFFDGALLGKSGASGFIGAAEMVAVMASLGLDVLLIDIVETVGSGRAVCDAVRACFDAHGDYGGTCFPIILQRDGHSQTVVGVAGGPPSSETGERAVAHTASHERLGVERALLIRDPIDLDGTRLRDVAESALEGKQYQLVVVSNNVVLDTWCPPSRPDGCIACRAHRAYRAYRPGEGLLTLASWLSETGHGAWSFEPEDDFAWDWRYCLARTGAPLPASRIVRVILTVIDGSSLRLSISLLGHDAAWDRAAVCL